MVGVKPLPMVVRRVMPTITKTVEGVDTPKRLHGHQSANGAEILDTESAGSGAVTQITFEHSTLNQHAMTLFEDALRVTNEGSQDVGFSVDASGSDDPNDLVGNALDIRKDGATIVDSGSGANAVDLDAGTSILLTIVIDLLNGNQGSDLSSINTVAVAARERDHSTS